MHLAKLKWMIIGASSLIYFKALSVSFSVNPISFIRIYKLEISSSEAYLASEATKLIAFFWQSTKLFTVPISHKSLPTSLIAYSVSPLQKLIVDCKYSIELLKFPPKWERIILALYGSHLYWLVND